jgi:myo-inositol 2-dehydrogenase/D-chiro-inositol 1-dehydrogenase
MIDFVLFGAGRIGRVHAQNILKSPRARVRYIVDADPSFAAVLAEECNAEVVDVDVALSDPGITAVLIASPTETHADLIERSARAGKAVFCEKPVDLNVDRVRSCLNVLESSGMSCAIGFNRRFDSQFLLLKERLIAGDIGRLESINIISRDPSPPEVDYIKKSGGLFRDMMIHDLDMARWLLAEEPVQISSAASCLVDSKIGEAGDVDTAMVTLQTASGKLCHISNSRRAVYGYDQRIEVFGSLGMIQANNNLESNLVVTTNEGAQSCKPMHFFLERYADAYKRELDHFLDCIEHNLTPSVGIDDGLKALILADAALESASSGKFVPL